MRKRKRGPQPTRNELNRAIAEYLNNGGKITKLDAKGDAIVDIDQFDIDEDAAQNYTYKSPVRLGSPIEAVDPLLDAMLHKGRKLWGSKEKT